MLAGASMVALLGGVNGADARAMNGGSAAPGMDPAVAQAGFTQEAAAAARRAQESLSRASQAVQGLRAAQDAARGLAQARASSVPNGLAPGGLVVAPGATPTATNGGAGLWQGALLPQQTQANGRTQVEIVQTDPKAILTWQKFNVGRETDLKFNQRAGGDHAANWIALNRVLDPEATPSRILGTIRADGQVYVVNKNGIVFDGASQVNVQTFAASTLAISNAQFMAGIAKLLMIEIGGANGYALPTFGEHAPNETVRGFVPDYVPGVISVEAGARIESRAGGKIMLFGSKVQNSGLISAPDGQVLLGAGEQVYLAASTPVRGLDIVTSAVPEQLLDGKSNYTSDTPEVRALLNARGAALDFRVINTGSMVADRGNITLHARNVEQRGELTASSALNNRGGSIRLQAWDGGTSQICSDSCAVGLTNLFSGTLTLGANSVTTVVPDVKDISEIEETALANRYERGQIELRGKLVEVQEYANVIVPAGKISVVAATNPQHALESFGGQADTAGDGSRIFIDSHATLSTAGLLDVSRPMESNVVKVELHINELQDSPLQRYSFLRGQRDIYVDRRVSGRFADGPMSSVEWYRNGNGAINSGAWYGSPIGNLSGWLNNTRTTLAALSTIGGEIFLKAGSDVIVKPGALLDVSGGSIRYEAGYINTTRLVGADGRIIDIGQAMPDRVYAGIAQGFVVDHARWGIKEIYTSPMRGGARFENAYTEGRAAGSIKIYAGGGFGLEGIIRGDVITGERQRAKRCCVPPVITSAARCRSPATAC